jgi:hypothetical protein
VFSQDKWPPGSIIQQYTRKPANPVEMVWKRSS